MIVQPRLASTILLLRDRATPAPNLEVFMVRRAVQSEFVPDVYVFPGGSASQDDRDAETTPGLCAPVATSAADPEGRTALGTGARAAAIREVFEEANVLLAYQDGSMLAVTEATEARFSAYRQAFNQRQGSLVTLTHDENLTLATDQLAYFAHWITPIGMPKRYDTHFFLASAPIAQEALYDQLETSDGMWVTPVEALERFNAGTFPLAFPTHRQLRDLSAYRTTREALAAAAVNYVPTKRSIIKDIDGVPHIMLLEDPEHPWSTQPL
ncbi:MAG TPA: hypothetical protein VHZ51_10840 [Ktedonobacteraceae bacterium]|jgi:8-oxo-dGTP pyrophosphatase MutT (NUDIX family)|nr:hypothetical protein [Ktedonobacteraceae bacterium]